MGYVIMTEWLNTSQFSVEHRPRHKSHKRKDLDSRVYASDEARLRAKKKADELQSILRSEFPSVVKPMKQSHVTGGFWLGFPLPFCRKHLPKHDEEIKLVDEDGHEWMTKYLSAKSGLSSGWRRFSIDHKLVDGDALVFQLIKPTTFKVHIIRVYGPGDHEILDRSQKAINVKRIKADIDSNSQREGGENQIKCQSLDTAYENAEEINMTILSEAASYSENDSDNPEPEVLDGIRLLESVIQFDQVKGIEDFTIQVDGLVVDSEIPKHLKTKYYDLCCTQKCFLHDHLIEGMNCKLVAGIISETVNIADAIKASNLTTPMHHFALWDKSLLTFVKLGMRVDFLRAHLDKLTNIAFKSKESAEIRRYLRARGERDRVEEEMRVLEAKMLELEKTKRELDDEIDTLKADVVEHENEFRKAVNAPW
ncbi:B3 DNA binding domain [Dillenia turbinata]|uniref:B3 DNA binding domain n=1 Tax=Dillenia turbinata TaxID=194707 RepID=A0AAN8UVY9_9MAGN